MQSGSKTSTKRTARRSAPQPGSVGRSKRTNQSDGNANHSIATKDWRHVFDTMRRLKRPPYIMDAPRHKDTPWQGEAEGVALPRWREAHQELYLEAERERAELQQRYAHLAKPQKHKQGSKHAEAYRRTV